MNAKRLLEPLEMSPFPYAKPGIVLLFIASAGCVFVAPLFMPASYSWVKNVISESAGQGVENAWIARLGFLCFGAAVLWLALSLRPVWARATYWMQAAFALFMFGTAAFSHKPWLEGVPFDTFEDFLHSVTATGMGFAFSFGVLARLLQRGSGAGWSKAGDALALLVATIMSPLGMLWPNTGGLLQRTMFLVAYLWFIHEALTAFPKKEPSKIQVVHG